MLKISLVSPKPSDRMVLLLEDEMAAMHDGKGAVATVSGTSALQLALMATQAEYVLAPSYSCVAILNAYRPFCKYILADNRFQPEKMDFNMKVTEVQAWDAVVVPHMFGVKADVHAMVDAAADELGGSAFIEDCAMALGAKGPWFGDMLVFSFHSSKIGGVEEGGMVVARTDEMLERLRDLNGYESAVVSDRLNPAPKYVYRMNQRMTNGTATEILTKKRNLPAILMRRQEIAWKYQQGLRELPVVMPKQIDGVWGRFVMDISGCQMTPEEFIRAMALEGIECGRGVYPALHQYLGQKGWEESNCERALRSLVALPMYEQLVGHEVQRIIEVAKRVLWPR